MKFEVWDLQGCKPQTLDLIYARNFDDFFGKRRRRKKIGHTRHRQGERGKSVSIFDA